MWNLKKTNSEKQRVERWLPWVEGVGKWGDICQRVQTSSYNKINKFGDVMYRMVIIANNTVSYT